MRNRLARAARCCALVFAAACAHLPLVHAASHDARELAALQAEAAASTYVRVLVGLGVDVPLRYVANPPPELRAALLAREDAIVAELGADVLRSTVWRSGFGQITLDVTAQGLAVLARSTSVANFTRDPTGDLRATVYRADGRLERIAAEITRKGYADVEVTHNLENFEFDLGTDGRVAHRPDRAQADEVAAKRMALLNRLPASGFPDMAAAKARAAHERGPMFRLRVNREGLLVLMEHPDIRGLRSASAAEVERPYLDPQALLDARKDGKVSVAIDLQRFAGYAPAQTLPDKARKAHDAAIQRAFRQILNQVAPAAAQDAQYLDGIATVFVTWPRAAVERLYASPDPRIVGVHASRVVGAGGLAQSTPLINVPQAWTAGVRGAGQVVAVLDGGIDRNHPFLRRANGTPKVAYEACASAPPGHLYFDNLCGLPPAADGDVVGSGAARPCGNYGMVMCQHGTHVAGIAAGRPAYGSSALVSGVAPDADLMAISVFSRRKSDGAIVFRDEDLAPALALTWKVGMPNLTVNISLQSFATFDAPCNAMYSFSYADSIDRLNRLTVPVVAITGNHGSRGRIAFPACLEGVIKVASTDDTAGQLSAFSNMADPARFKGNFLAAPGDAILSSTSFAEGALGYPYAVMRGTSMAAPHVAGLFALIKSYVPGAPVTNMAAYLFNTGVAIASPYGTALRRVRLPSL